MRPTQYLASRTKFHLDPAIEYWILFRENTHKVWRPTPKGILWNAILLGAFPAFLYYAIKDGEVSNWT
jgi:hypothetical protein